MHIAILAYDGISPYLLSTPVMVFGEPFALSSDRLSVCASQARLRSAEGLTLEVPCDLARARDADLVILPGWRNPQDSVDPEILDVLSQAADRGAVVVGLCLGAFGLAEAGLLAGKRATTHWQHAARLAERFKDVCVDSDALFIDEGHIVTSAGLAAGLDCCLHVLGRMRGVTEANRVARHLVAAPQRQGEQPQLLKQAVPASSTAKRLSDALEALRNAPEQKPSLNHLAEQVGLSRRSLTRHIRERTGGSLQDWMRHIRVAKAQEEMVRGTFGLDRVALLSGFSDSQALRAAFKATLGMTPSQWIARQRFAMEHQNGRGPGLVD
ncbi:GlxA family transcriptional regulator [Pseudomonas sp. Marseille-QA0892]